ncbi:hypothetical protein MBLNU230_g0776t1 [Neophaeotheca triangularis]
MAADPEVEEDLFADLYDGEADDPPTHTEPAVKSEPQAQVVKTETAPEPETEDYNDDDVDITGGDGGGMQDVQGAGAVGGNQNGNVGGFQQDDSHDRPIGIKEDG